MRKLILTVDLNVLNEEKEILKAQDTTTVIATILENNEPANLEGLIGKVIFTKPDGTVVFQDSDITIEENVVTTKLLPECLEISGKNAKLEIEFRNADDEIISTFRIPIEIEPTGKECELSKKSSSYAEKIEKELKRLDEVKADRTELDNKVNIKEGYSLVEDSEIEKLKTLVNYDDTNIKNDIKALEIDLEETKADIGDIAVDVNNLEIEVSNLSDGINNIAEDVSRIDTKVNTIVEDVQKNKTEILDIEENLNLLEDSKADRTEIPDVSEFIKKTVDNLVNYYKKSETYTQEEVNNLIGAIKTAHFEVVENLPEIGETNIIYLLPKTTAKENDIYDEYIYINGAYEFIGSTAVDLSNYYNKDEINTILFDYITSNDLEEVLKDYVTIAMKYDFVKDGLVNNTNELSDMEKLKIETWLGLPENYLTYYNETPYIVNKDYIPAHKKYVDGEINKLDNRIDEIELFKFPNMTIIGTPTIQNGQVSNFTMNDYLEFPFLVDFRGRPFEINFAFTTGNNVTTQQNILDSSFGLALAIKNSKILMAISYNGTTWANQYTGNLTIEPNTTYLYRITWNGMLYKVQYYNGSQYVDDFYFAATQQPYPKQMFIGVSRLSDNYFEGSINLNYANLKIDGNIVWSGMDDAGLASRLATDLSNIDEAGKIKIKDIIKEEGYIIESQMKDYIDSLDGNNISY